MQQKPAPVREHSPHCLYAGPPSRVSKLSMCSVVSSSSIASGERPTVAKAKPGQARGQRAASSTSSAPSADACYKTDHFYCCRRSESALLAEKYPDKVPVSSRARLQKISQ